MLRWMVLDNELTAFCTKAKVQPFTSVITLTGRLLELAGELSGPRMDAAIRQEFSPELAAKLLGKSSHERLDDDPIEWDESEGPRLIDPGFFLYATQIDWDEGTLWAEAIPDHTERFELLFPSDDLLASEFDRAEFDVWFWGMSFESNAIELLLPNVTIPSSSLKVAERPDGRRSLGRPPKWNWEGVLAFIVGQAQTPDGLPTGSGAQARIEEMIADWFTTETGDAPAPSQIRQRAAAIIRSLGTAAKDENAGNMN